MNLLWCQPRRITTARRLRNRSRTTAAGPSVPFVLNLPGLLVHEVCAAQAEVHLRVVAEVDHAGRGVDGAAAPALDAPVLVQVDGGDRFGAHVPSVSALIAVRK